MKFNFFPDYLATAKAVDHNADPLTIAENKKVCAIIKHSFKGIRFDEISGNVLLALDYLVPVTFEFDDGEGFSTETITLEKFPKALYFEAIKGFYGIEAMLEAHALRERLISMGGGGLWPYVGAFDREFRDQFPRIDVSPLKFVYDVFRAVPYQPIAQFEKIGIYLSPAFALMTSLALFLGDYFHHGLLGAVIATVFGLITLLSLYPIFVAVTEEVSKTGWTSRVNPFTNLSEEKWTDLVGAVTEEVLYYWPQGRR